MSLYFKCLTNTLCNSRFPRLPHSYTFLPNHHSTPHTHATTIHTQPVRIFFFYWSSGFLDRCSRDEPPVACQASSSLEWQQRQIRTGHAAGPLLGEGHGRVERQCLPAAWLWYIQRSSWVQLRTSHLFLLCWVCWDGDSVESLWKSRTTKARQK